MIDKKDKRWLICASCCADCLVNWRSPGQTLVFGHGLKNAYSDGVSWTGNHCRISSIECPYQLKDYEWHISGVRLDCQIKGYFEIKEYLEQIKGKKSEETKTRLAREYADKHGFKIWHNDVTLEEGEISIGRKWLCQKKDNIKRLTDVKMPRRFKTLNKSYGSEERAVIKTYFFEGLVIRVLRFKEIVKFEVGVSRCFVGGQLGILQNDLNKKNFYDKLDLLFAEAKNHVERFDFDGKVVVFGGKELSHIVESDGFRNPQDYQNFSTWEQELFAYDQMSKMGTHIPW